MELDDRAQKAAHDLRHHATVDLDIPTAASSVAARAGRRRTVRRQARAGVAALLVVAATGALGVAAIHGGGEDRALPKVETDRTTVPDGPTTTVLQKPATPAQILEALPDEPLVGKDSWRLPVTASPQSGLVDQQSVTVIGKGFEPNESLAIVQCGAEANTGEAQNACGLGTPESAFAYISYLNADASGSLVGEVVVRQVLDTPIGQIDCASAAERCILGIGAMANYDRSGSTYITFAGAPGFAEPQQEVSPTDGLAEGDSVTLTATGLVPGRKAGIRLCHDDLCTPLGTPMIAADGTLTATVPLAYGLGCTDACTIGLFNIDGPGTAAPEPEPIPVAFVPGAGGAFEAPPTTTTTTTAPEEAVIVEIDPDTGELTTRPVDPGQPLNPVNPLPGNTIPAED